MAFLLGRKEAKKNVKFQDICKLHQYYQEAWISALRKLIF